MDLLRIHENLYAKTIPSHSLVQLLTYEHENISKSKYAVMLVYLSFLAKCTDCYYWTLQSFSSYESAIDLHDKCATFDFKDKDAFSIRLPVA